MQFIAQLVLAALSLAFGSFEIALASPAPGESAPSQSDGARLTLAKQVVSAMHPDGRLMLMLAIKLNPVAVGLDFTGPNTDRSRVEAYRDATSEIIKAAIPSLEGITAQMYAQQLTEDQLSSVLAFYHSATGQAFVAASDRIPMTLEIAGDFAWRIFALEALEDYCRRVPCTDKELETLNNIRAPLVGRAQPPLSPTPKAAPPPGPVPAAPNSGTSSDQRR